MKKQYDGVVALKNASGFTYSDKDGAGIKPEQKDIWKRYVKVRTGYGPGSTIDEMPLITSRLILQRNPSKKGGFFT